MSSRFAPRINVELAPGALWFRGFFYAISITSRRHPIIEMETPEYGLREMFLPDESPAGALARLKAAQAVAPSEAVRLKIADGIEWLVNVHQLEE